MDFTLLPRKMDNVEVCVNNTYWRLQETRLRRCTLATTPAESWLSPQMARNARATFQQLNVVERQFAFLARRRQDHTNLESTKARSGRHFSKNARKLTKELEPRKDSEGSGFCR
jgi:hypothetical protein